MRKVIRSLVALGLFSSILTTVNLPISPASALAPINTDGLVLNLDGSNQSSVSGTNWIDQSSNAFTATGVNSPTYNPSDGSWSFNGTNQYFNLGNVLPFSGISPFTIEVTFTPSSVTGTPSLVSRQNSNVAGNYFVGINGSKAFYYIENTPWGISSSTTLGTNNKYVLTQVVDSSHAITPYLNGVQDGTKTTFGSTGSSNINLQIGAGLTNSAASGFFSGKIFSVRIYSRALSSTEVGKNYAATPKVALSNFALNSGCIWGTQMDYAVKIQSGTTTTVNLAKMIFEASALDSTFQNSTQLEIWTDNAGATGSLVGILRPSILYPAANLSGSTSASRVGTYTGSVTLSASTNYWFVLNNTLNQLLSMCQAASSFATANNSWSAPTTGGYFYIRVNGSYSTYPSIFAMEISTGSPDTYAPIITGPNSSTGASVSTTADENSAWTTTYVADEWVTWSLSGSDSATFTITQAGLITLSAKNFEVRSDANLDGIFQVIVTAKDSVNNSTSQTLSITIADVSEYPVFNTGGGAATFSISVNENQTSVLTLSASDPDTGSVLTFNFADNTFDQSKFNLNNSSGVLTFKVAPDFEIPTDTNLDNVYKVNVAVSDGANVTTLLISVQILDVNESTTINVPSISVTLYKGIAASISVSADNPGKVRFLVNGKRIPSCLAISTSGSAPNVTAVCSWKPNVQGMQKITAQLSPTNSSLTSSTSPILNVFINKRTGNR